MPVHSTPGGGYQWGGSGKVYTGAGARSKAAAQGAAAHASGYKRDVNRRVHHLDSGRSGRKRRRRG